jgi:sterol desaturase/sphingolipid hydroxylase (fatty acid hydroxylase superfamily)
MSLINRIFDMKAAPLLTVIFVVLVIAERRRRLRKTTQLNTERVVINSLVAAPSFGLLRFVFLPAMVKLALKNKGHGVAQILPISNALRFVLAFLILDYGNYLWHVLNHKIPFLWRFHLVHHTDLDLDTFTAFRFHFGEMIGSVFFRGLFVLLSGASALEVLIYELGFEGATQFHHSNLKLPEPFERNLSKLIVTPKIHGIHHSINKNDTDSNYSVIFSFWDRLHRTFQYYDNQYITIGVPAYRDPAEMTVGYLLLMPFRKIRGWNADKTIK